MIKKIISTSNPLVKELVRLKKRSVRDNRDLFLIEGYRPVKRALEQKIKLEELYFSPEWFLGENELKIVARSIKNGVSVIELSKEAFAKIAYRKRPEGLIAVSKQWHTKLEDLKLPQNAFVLILQSIEKPGNLGTILRTADATGVDAVIVCDPITDVFNPNVVRASTGTLFSVPIVITSTSNAIEFCKSNKMKTVAATPDTDTKYTGVNMNQSVALILGSEMFGLTDDILKNCDLKVKIPMLGIADSLNVSAATVVLAYEVVRQRSLMTGE